MFLKTVKQVKLEVRPLFLPQLVQLTSLLKPGLTRIKVRKNELEIFVFYCFLCKLYLPVDKSQMARIL